MRRAADLLDQLLHDLLPQVEVVVLLGRQAQNGWDAYCAAGGNPPPRVGLPLRGPSTSPQAWNNLDRMTGGPNSELTVEALVVGARRLRL